jgi:FkbM family methyltransferase
MSRIEQKYPSSTNKIRGIKYECLSFLNHRGTFQTKIKPFDISFSLYSNDAVSKSIYLENFEKETVNFFNRVIRPGDCVYDIGANIGFFSLIFSRLVGPNGQVHSFEPSWREMTVLYSNIRFNRIANIFLNQIAVSDKTGYEQLNVFNESIDGVYNSMGKIFNPKAINKPTHQETTRTICLDEYISLFHPAPSVMKIDTEGAEFLILRGAKDLLSSPSAPMIVIEECPLNLKGFDVSVTDLRELLLSYGYALFQINPDGTLRSVLPRAEEHYSENIVAAKPDHVGSIPV